MKEPIWISETLARAIHDRQLAEHGGLAGVRDEGSFLAVLDRPRNKFAYMDQLDMALLAACYAYGIATAHPFSDGNKRTALVVCRTFLRLNGYDLQVERMEKYQTIYDLAAGLVTEEALAAWIRDHLVVWSNPT